MTYHNHPLSRAPGPVAHPARSRGFTVIELMVVIGVILVLIGIAVIGLNALTAGARSDATKTTLETLRAMKIEYETTSKRTAASLETGLPGCTGTPPTYTIDATNRDVSEDGAGRALFNINTTDDPTQEVMRRLLAIPANRTTFAQLPSKSLLSASPTPNPPVPVDGWNNPIIFVPSGGLAGVTVGDSANVTVRTSEREPWFSFFASAGPDGNFQTGDDNVYSFQN